MQRAVTGGLAKRDLGGIRYAGIDEKSFRRGQDYVSVMTDGGNSRVIDVVPGRTEESADRLWDSLTIDQREQGQRAHSGFNVVNREGLRQSS